MLPLLLDSASCLHGMFTALKLFSPPILFKTYFVTVVTRLLYPWIISMRLTCASEELDRRWPSDPKALAFKRLLPRIRTRWTDASYAATNMKRTLHTVECYHCNGADRVASDNV